MQELVFCFFVTCVKLFFISVTCVRICIFPPGARIAASCGSGGVTLETRVLETGWWRAQAMGRRANGISWRRGGAVHGKGGFDTFLVKT